MGNLFHIILYQPIFNLLVFLYEVIPGSDIGFAIIALTILIKLLLWPLMSRSLKSQKALQDLQPKIEALKAEHGSNREALAKATMELYQKEQVNPLSSCLPILVQLPVLIALYRVLLHGFGSQTMVSLYAFVPDPGTINHVFLHAVDLSVPSLYLAVTAGYFQFMQTRMMIQRRPPKQVQGKKGVMDEEMLVAMNRSMLYFMPVITTVIGATLPAGLTLYWVTVNIVSILQQQLVFSRKRKEEAKAV